MFQSMLTVSVRIPMSLLKQADAQGNIHLRWTRTNFPLYRLHGAKVCVVPGEHDAGLLVSTAAVIVVNPTGPAAGIDKEDWLHLYSLLKAFMLSSSPGESRITLGLLRISSWCRISQTL